MHYSHRRIHVPLVLQKKHINGTAGIFFDFLADGVKIFLKKHKLSDRARIDLGFTFSFHSTFIYPLGLNPISVNRNDFGSYV